MITFFSYSINRQFGLYLQVYGRLTTLSSHSLLRFINPPQNGLDQLGQSFDLPLCNIMIHSLKNLQLDLPTPLIKHLHLFRGPFLTHISIPAPPRQINLRPIQALLRSNRRRPILRRTNDRSTEPYETTITARGGERVGEEDGRPLGETDEDHLGGGQREGGDRPVEEGEGAG